MAFCTKCGTKIEEGERFCTGCGTPVGEPQVQMNSTTVTANKTVSCQGCLLNNKGVKCTYYDCTISEAEKYDCGMRGAPELQQKQKNSRVIRTIVIVALYALLGWVVPGEVERLFGINSWITVVIIILIGNWIDYSTDQSSKKKRRENAKRL